MEKEENKNIEKPTEEKIETLQQEGNAEKKEEIIIEEKVVEEKEETPKNNESVEENTTIKEQKEDLKQTEKKEVVNETQKENSSEEYKIEKKGKDKKKLIAIITVAIIIFVGLLFSVIFSLLNMNNEKILNGISILGIDVGDLTVEEATKQIQDAVSSRFQDENNTLILKRGEEEISVTANTFNAKFDIEKSVKEAYNIGRDGNIITNNYAILLTNLFKKDLQSTLYLDEELLKSTIKDASAKMKDAVIENSYHVEDETLKIVRGKAGYIINEEELKNKIYEQLSNIHSNYQIIEIPTIHKEPDPIDLEKIHSEIYKKPQDAYVEKTNEDTKVHTHVNGIDFKISMDEAKKLLEEEKEEYTIPLKITVPDKTINDLGEEAFPDLLATFSTIYDASNRNRSTNIELASKKINGTVIMPGENFSYNTTVGRATEEAGFKEGTAYIGGKVVPDVGGGICQLSSTLYNATLLANLEIVERSNHMFLTGYVAASRDATVYYGSLDYIFKNTRSYPIKIVAQSQNGVCKVSIYGIKEKVEYEVVIQSKITSYINYSTKYESDSTLPEGKEVVEQSGSNGCRSEAYRILKLNGKVVSQTLLSKDIYDPMQKIVRRGTKKVTTTTSQTTSTTNPTTNTTTTNTETTTKPTSSETSATTNNKTNTTAE